ncbi:hypothetical protein NEOLEDRAFT_1070661 [Neolentinus lepideus HHB14362 ss-1]|uniref:Uncharacterized protein n=1 Tax=Neolentinus lepideus HHB14362 ss-1 TaxID=1314782 RepID=A0A165QU01_9AGAM|nr:hypothetical protein NEOLEDRAFT_1070661 [Neolentinus lepideus HHB14362 ss-1]
MSSLDAIARSDWTHLFDFSYDSQLSVTRYASPASICNLAKTCHHYRKAITAQVPELWNINKHLRRWFLDPIAFRNLQARTATLISGSSALQFLDRTVYDDSDLDIYVFSEHLREVCQWIMSQGYVYAPKHQQNHSFQVAVTQDPTTVKLLYRMRGVRNIIDLQHPVNGQKVQVIAAEKTPIEIILHFHSTCVMNVISFEKAYSLYPTATFEQRRSLILASDGPSQEPAQQKYRERGWTLLAGISSQERWDGRRAMSTTPRWIEDRFAWVIPLDLTNVVQPQEEHLLKGMSALVNDPVVMTSWKLKLLDDDEIEMDCRIMDATVRSCRYTYAVLHKSFWHNYLYWFLRNLLKTTGTVLDVNNIR